MDLVKYLIIAIGCVILGIIISILARNILAGLGFAVLSFGAYILWNLFKSANKDN